MREARYQETSVSAGNKFSTNFILLSMAETDLRVNYHSFRYHNYICSSCPFPLPTYFCHKAVSKQPGWFFTVEDIFPTWDWAATMAAISKLASGSHFWVSLDLCYLDMSDSNKFSLNHAYFHSHLIRLQLRHKREAGENTFRKLPLLDGNFVTQMAIYGNVSLSL